MNVSYLIVDEMKNLQKPAEANSTTWQASFSHWPSFSNHVAYTYMSIIIIIIALVWLI